MMHGRMIYHMRPETMVGSTLYPLNDLPARLPDIYRREIAKYDDRPSRQALPETVLPRVGWRWNDVIHCSSVHPHLLYREWTRHRDDIDPALAFFAIPIAAVAHLPLAVMKPASPDREREVAPIRPADYREVTEVSGETRTWYARLAAQGRFGGHFVGVPHVLVKGSIDVRELPVIRWGDAPNAP